jgi:hypothetical protein
MSLQEDQRNRVLELLRSLPDAWKHLLLQALGLDLAATDLPTALMASTRIDRSRPGFEDLDPSITRLIEPGRPGLSALYHAFASPRVAPASPASWWPSLEDLDLLEDWITGLIPLDPKSLPAGAVIGVFAYEYRTAAEMPDRLYAGFLYSRTGIARIGDADPNWDGASRSWNNRPPDGRAAFAATLARYAAFIAVPARVGDGASLLGKTQDGDDNRTFYLPIRKLVQGEPIGQSPLALKFGEYHRREKLLRLFQNGGYETKADLKTWPFVRDSLAPGENASGARRSPERIVDFSPLGSSVVVASPAAPLVRVALEPGGAIAVLPKVPARSVVHNGNFALNRDASSLRVNTGGLSLLKDAIVNGLLDENRNVRPRNAPEFANIRHEVTEPGDKLTDLNATLGDNFRDTVNEGGYAAALFEDSVCDGILSVEVPALQQLGPCLPAFSVVAAPDFFPHVGELDIQSWVDLVDGENTNKQFKAGTPVPLCQGRFPPNVTLRPPFEGGRAFSKADDTAVAVVSATQHGAPPSASAQPRLSQASTFLADGASDAFAPGWDVTFSEENGQRFYSTFGLGSPFAEDAKLCAADNGFWPAASPDAGRTFRISSTSIPLLDDELGWYPGNPLKPADEPASWGWDGEQGPFIASATDVNYADYWRSDYVSNVLAGRFGSEKLAKLQRPELLARMEALRLCIQALPGKTDVADTKLWLVHAGHASVPPSEGAAASASGYRYEFVLADGDDKPDPSDQRRRLQPFSQRYECLAGAAGVSWRSVGGEWAWVSASARA